MNIINSIITNTNNVMYGYLLLAVFFVVAVFFTIRLKGIQISHSIHALKLLFSKHEKGDGVSGFVSFCISTASRVGTGNITGVMGAVSAGGPGALFWMWIMALLGGSLAFSESTLAQLYKEKDSMGKFIGGASFYIKSKLKKPVLATLFALCMIFTYTTFNGVQANTISNALSKYNVSVIITAVILTIITALILFSKKRDTITHACVFIVPIMAIPYILMGLFIFFTNLPSVPSVFQNIFIQAFKPSAIFGGAIGITISNGLKRGLFSNEAGMGSTPHAHAIAKVDHPCEQGVVAMMGVFFTFIVLTLTALVILTSGILENQVYNLESPSLISESLKGIGLAQSAFQMKFGHVGVIFIALCLLFFAFSTIIAWYFFGEQNIKYLFGQKAAKVYALVVVVFIFIGSTLKVDLVWSLADCFNGLMVIPNLLGILALSPLVSSLVKDYKRFKKEKKNKAN